MNQIKISRGDFQISTYKVQLFYRYRMLYRMFKLLLITEVMVLTVGVHYMRNQRWLCDKKSSVDASNSPALYMAEKWQCSHHIE